METVGGYTISRETIDSGRKISKATKDDITVAVKIIRNPTDKEIKRIKIWETFDHSNIIKLIECIHLNDKIYLFMELGDKDLYKCIEETCFFSEEASLVMLEQIAKAIKYMHDKGISHRDVKSDNIISHNGKWKLIDFEYIDENEKSTECKGTPLFISPEEIKDNIYYLKPTDVWSLGITYYEMIFSVTPFDGYNRDKVIKSIVNDKIKLNNKKLSEKSIILIKGMLNKNPAERLTIDKVLTIIQK